MLGLPLQRGMVRESSSPLVSAWKGSRIYWSKKLFHQDPLSYNIPGCPLILGENEILSLLNYHLAGTLLLVNLTQQNWLELTPPPLLLQQLGITYRQFSASCLKDRNFQMLRTKPTLRLICTLQEKSLNLWGGVKSLLGCYIEAQS